MTIDVTDIDRKLATASPLTAKAFARVFERMQRSSEPVSIAGLKGDAAAPEDTEARAFAWARQNGHLASLISEIMQFDVSPALQEAARAAGLEVSNNNLQKILDPQNPWIDPMIFATKLPQAANHICVVRINGKAMGTGFLIAPTAVVTAFHVIETLVEPVGKSWKAREGSHRSLVFQFGLSLVQIDGGSRLRDDKMIPAASHWDLTLSGYHAKESLSLLPDNMAELDTFYDLAVCRLATRVEVGLNGLELETELKLGARPMQIGILQHPGGEALKYDRDLADAANNPAYRVFHRVNTFQGSSGAPCLNDKFRVVAMHQAGPADGPQRPVNGGEPLNRNRGVPIFWSLSILEQIPSAEPDLMPLYKLPSGQPVYGRGSISNWLGGNIHKQDIEPILGVAGEGKPGKTFTYDIIKALLPANAHRVPRLNARRLAGVDGPGALNELYNVLELPKPQSNGEALTTDIGHLRRIAIPALFKALADTAGPDVWTWLVIDDFGRAELTGEPGGARDVINLLLEQTVPETRLRIALLDYREDLVPPDSRHRVLKDELHKPTAEDIEAFWRLRGQTDGALKELVAVTLGLIELLPFDAKFYRKLTNVINKTGEMA